MPGFLHEKLLTLADFKSKLRRFLVAYDVHCRVYDRAHLPQEIEWRVK